MKCNWCGKEKEGVEIGICNHCGRFGKPSKTIIEGMMEQWIIDRYNKGQDKFKYDDDCITDLTTGDIWQDVNDYDFLFNPKWGFGEAFTENWKCSTCIYKGRGCVTCLDVFKSEMAISPDPLKYLEQFKGE